MVRQPAVFLMDEPLSNLDAALRISMRAEIKQLHQAMATTFVYVTHDQAEALTLADRIVVMKDGVVQQIGPPEEIYDQPRNMFVAAFLGNPPINFLEGVLEEDAEGVLFRRGHLTSRLPPHIARPVAGQGGRQVVLGIRPEDVDERAVPAEGETIHGHVTSVLPVGSDQYLAMQVEGLDLFFRVGKDLRHKAGENAALLVDVNRLHLFAKDTGQTLIW